MEIPMTAEIFDAFEFEINAGRLKSAMPPINPFANVEARLLCSIFPICSDECKIATICRGSCWALRDEFLKICQTDKLHPELFL